MSDGYREVEQMKAEQAKKSMESLKALTTNKSIRNRLERERYTEPVSDDTSLADTSRTLCRLNSRAVSRVGIDSLSFRKELVGRVIHFIGINCSSQILVIFEKSLKLLSERYIPP